MSTFLSTFLSASPFLSTFLSAVIFLSPFLSTFLSTWGRPKPLWDDANKMGKMTRRWKTVAWRQGAGVPLVQGVVLSITQRAALHWPRGPPPIFLKPEEKCGMIPSTKHLSMKNRAMMWDNCNHRVNAVHYVCLSPLSTVQCNSVCAEVKSSNSSELYLVQLWHDILWCTSSEDILSDVQYSTFWFDEVLREGESKGTDDRPQLRLQTSILYLVA